MRAKFTSQAVNECILEYDDIATGERRFEFYYAPPAGGYVRVNDHKQVCAGLSTLGSTLIWRPEDGDLVNKIRREYRRGRR